ncbi:MAG: DUF1320 domain-containing protein [Hyphomicrobiaceae bacterium]|nr:DUF1320 domain-containing protein [Hyphomicrobiaceae bacterium]
MTYATQQDLIVRFGERELIQRTDRALPQTTIDTDVVARHLGDAEALVDGYLAKAATLPLAAIPPALTKVTCDIARYYLWGETAERDGPVHRAHGEALRWLRDVADGRIRLDVGGEPVAQPGGGAVSYSGADRVFSRDTLRGM